MPLNQHAPWVALDPLTPLRLSPFLRRASLVVALGMVAGYALLLAWFDNVDFYRSGFFTPGWRRRDMSSQGLFLFPTLRG